MDSPSVKTTDEKKDIPFAPALIVVVVLSAAVFGFFGMEQYFWDTWKNETGARIADIKTSCTNCAITAEPSGSTWTITVTYDGTDRARVAVYASPWKSSLIPMGMTKFYDSLIYGPFKISFSVGGCGSTFVSVGSLFTREGTWIERPPRYVCM